MVQVEDLQEEVRQFRKAAAIQGCDLELLRSILLYMVSDGTSVPELFKVVVVLDQFYHNGDKARLSLRRHIGEAATSAAALMEEDELESQLLENEFERQASLRSRDSVAEVSSEEPISALGGGGRKVTIAEGSPGGGGMNVQSQPNP